MHRERRGRSRSIFFSRSRKKNGEWTAYKEFRITQQQIEMLQDPVDADAISMMLGGQDYVQLLLLRPDVDIAQDAAAGAGVEGDPADRANGAPGRVLGSRWSSAR